MDTATAEEWRLMQFDWDTAYLFAYDEGSPEPFSAARRDDPSVVLTATDPGALRDMVYRNYLERKVPREFAP